MRLTSVNGIEGALVDPLAVPIDVPDLERLAGELAGVNDCVGIYRSKAPLEIDDARRPVVQQDPREVGEDVVRGRIDDQDRFHVGSVPTRGPVWPDRGLAGVLRGGCSPHGASGPQGIGGGSVSGLRCPSG